MSELQSKMTVSETEHMTNMEKVENEKHELKNSLQTIEERYQSFHCSYDKVLLICIITRLTSVQDNLTNSKENEVKFKSKINNN